MKREIKFRGVSRKDGSWIYGLPAHTSGGDMGIIADWFGEDGNEQYQQIEVVNESIGQFTGLKDKEGKEIYEGDILKMVHQKTDIGAVEYIGNGFWIKSGGDQFMPADHLCEVIGNIYESPELLNPLI